MSNPLLPTAPPPPPPPEQVETSPVLGGELAARFGPQEPLTNVAAPTGGGLPTEQVTADPLLWVVGVHGGSGASTVAALCGPDALELPQRLPMTAAGAPPPRVLLVARTHATGLHYAGWMAAHWATGETGVHLLGLVVLDDAPRLPPVLVTEIKRVAGMVPALWHLPWVEAWRTSLDLDLTTVPRRTRKSITQIRRAAETTRDHHPGAGPDTHRRPPDRDPAGHDEASAAPPQPPLLENGFSEMSAEFPRGRIAAS